MRLVSVVALTLVSFAAAPPSGRSGFVVVRVIEDVSRQPLANAEVIDLGSSVRRFTNERGEARVTWPGDGRLHLRVRQLGFKFTERTLTRPPGMEALADTFALERVAFVLPQRFTRATNTCATDDDTDARFLSASVLEQLRMGAERYESFRRAYPFGSGSSVARSRSGRTATRSGIAPSVWKTTTTPGGNGTGRGRSSIARCSVSRRRSCS